MVELQIQHGSEIFEPATEDGIEVTTYRKSSPSVMKFKVLKEGTKGFQEGDAVKLTVDGVPVFFGFVFSKERNKENIITVTCYDQLRYLKNKDTYVYENKTANQLIQMIADDFQLKTGTLDDTSFVIESRVEDNQTLFDIIQTALDITLRNTGKMFVLYDDFGKLTLKSLDQMKNSVLIDAETGENFKYKSSIDDNTYDQIKLIYDNEETGTREVYISKSGANINQWGVLQYFEKIDSPDVGKTKTDALLKLYNTKTRTLTIENAFGDTSVRAGVLIPVMLNLGDIIVGNYMLVERCKHTFKNDEHTMNLDVRGGEFV